MKPVGQLWGPPPPLRLRPVFKERIWAGQAMAGAFGYDTAGGRVGECWGISAHPQSESTVVGGVHDAQTLLEVWEKDRAFFGDDTRTTFPLLVKFLDTGDWLSVQVHPDDLQAVQLEGVPLGKAECWYVVAAVPGAELVLGHTASDARELERMIDTGGWDELLVRRQVVAGDFLNIPAGTIHAAGPGLLLYEVQQNCDTTYRVHDFHRKDRDGLLRDLHLDKSKLVSVAPYDPTTTFTAQDPRAVPGGRHTVLVRSAHFEVDRHEVEGPGYSVEFPSYELVTVIAGSGRLAFGDHQVPIAAGDHLVLPAGAGPVAISGVVTLVTSRPAPA